MRVPFSTRALALLSCLGLVGCGTDAPPSAPTLQLPFTSSAASPVLFNNVQGVVVGTTGGFAFGALNAGTQSLVVQTVTYDGDEAMSLEPFVPPLPVTLTFNDELIVTLSCTPPTEAAYAGTVTVQSNAVNAPQAVVYLSCVGTATPESQSLSGVTSTFSK
jgi:uncharacterized membrane protein